MVRPFILSCFVSCFAAVAAFGADFEVPSPPTIGNEEYKLIVVSYSENTLSQETQAQLAGSFIKSLGELGFGAVTVGSMKDLQVSVKSLQTQLIAALAAVNNSLPEKPVYWNVVYLPINNDSLISKSQRLKKMDINFEGQLSLLNNVIEVQQLSIPREDLISDESFEWYTSTSNSLAQHIHGMSQVQGSQFYFSALQTQMKLQKDQSEVQVQALVGFPGQNIPMDVVNQQVRVQSAEIPNFTEIFDQNAGIEMAEAPGYFSQSPVATLTMAFSQAEASKEPELALAFGAFNGLGGLSAFDNDVVDSFALAGTALPSEVGAQQWLSECQLRMKSTPSLQGLLAKGAVGNGNLGELVEKADINIGFHFFNMWFQFDDATGAPYIPPGNLDVRVSILGGAGGYGECIVMSDVNKQLNEEINATLSEQLKELVKVDSLAESLMDQF